jgi:hypothetical protein
MSASHSQPSESQIKPLVESHNATWHWFTRAIVISVVHIVVLLVLMAVFLVKHHPAG